MSWRNQGEDDAASLREQLKDARRKSSDWKTKYEQEVLRQQLQKRMTHSAQKMQDLNQNAPHGRHSIKAGAQVEVFSESYQEWVPGRVTHVSYNGDVTVFYSDDPTQNEPKTKVVDIRSAFIKPLSEDREQEWSEYLQMYQSNPGSECDVAIEQNKIFSMFRHFDADKDGFLSYDEFMNMLRDVTGGEASIAVDRDEFEGMATHDQGLTVENLREFYDEQVDRDIDEDFEEVFPEGPTQAMAEQSTSQLKEQIVTLSSTNHQLKRRCERLEAELAGSEERVSRVSQGGGQSELYKADVEDLKKVVRSLGGARQLEDFEEDSVSRRDEAMMQSRLNKRKGTGQHKAAARVDNTYKSQIEQLEEELTETNNIKAQLESTRTELEICRKKIEAMNTENNKIKDELKKAHYANQETKDQLNGVKSRVEQLTVSNSTLEQVDTQLQSKVDQVKVLKEKTREKDIEIQDMKARLEDSRLRVEQMDKLKKQIHDVIKEKDEMFNRQIQDSINEATREREKNSNLLMQIRDLQDQVTEHAAYPDQAKLYAKDLQKQVSDRESESRELRQGVNALRQQLANAQREVEYDKDNYRKLRGERDQLKKERDGYNDKVKDEREKSIELMAENAQLRREVKQSSIRITALAHEAKECSVLRNNVNYLQQEVNSMFESQPREKRKAEHRIRSLQAMLQRKEEELTRFAKLHTNKLRRQVEDQKRRLQEYEVQTKRLQGKCKQLATENEKVKNDAEENEDELKILKENAAEAREQIEDQLTQQLTRARYATGELKTNLEAERAEKERIKAIAENQQGAVVELQQKLAAAVQKIRSLSDVVGRTSRGGGQETAGAGGRGTPGRGGGATADFMDSFRNEVTSEFSKYQEQTREAAFKAFDDLKRRIPTEASTVNPSPALSGLSATRGRGPPPLDAYAGQAGTPRTPRAPLF